jgi:hypothetical protein
MIKNDDETNDSKCSSYRTILSEQDNDDNTYVIKTRVCTRLSKELQLPEFVFDDIGEYNPPKEHGLHNSDVIIPEYYHLDRHPSQIIDLDYLRIIKDDIRNLRILNETELDYIKNLDHDQKNELFMIFNECVKFINEYVNESNCNYMTIDDDSKSNII